MEFRQVWMGEELGPICICTVRVDASARETGTRRKTVVVRDRWTETER